MKLIRPEFITNEQGRLMNEVIRSQQFVDPNLKTIQIYSLLREEEKFIVSNENEIKLKENKSDRLKQLFKELGRLLNMTSYFLIIGTFTSEKLDLSEIFRNNTINV
jgi:uncharacterized membrane protein YraQ (UPF0718 family)